MTKKALLAAAVALLPLLGCGSTDPADETFTARLDEAEVVVPIPSPSLAFSGDASFTFEGQAIAFSADLRGLALNRHPHRYLRLRVHAGPRGTNGPSLAVVTVMEPDIPAGDRYLWQGRLGASELDAGHTLEEVMGAMRANGAYVQVTHWHIGDVGPFGLAQARGQIQAPAGR
jgi:hypothetical protein